MSGLEKLECHLTVSQIGKKKSDSLCMDLFLWGGRVSPPATKVQGNLLLWKCRVQKASVGISTKCHLLPQTLPGNKTRVLATRGRAVSVHRHWKGQTLTGGTDERKICSGHKAALGLASYVNTKQRSPAAGRERQESSAQSQLLAKAALSKQNREC